MPAMDVASQRFRTVRSPNGQSASSSLLESGSWSNYGSEVSQPPATPAESIIRQEWHETLHANLLEQWQNARDSSTGAWFILRCLCLPCIVLMRTINGPCRKFRPQTGIMYLYAYLCLTVVVNLTVALNGNNLSMGGNSSYYRERTVTQASISTLEYIQKSFVILGMLIAIILMRYLYRDWYQTVDFPHKRGGLFRSFYEGGILLFGLLSMGYSVAVVIGYVKCYDGLDAPRVLNIVVAATKAIFILAQILFLHFFYGARIPEETPYIEVIMAHLLGTNLALWFWTLCSEEVNEMLDDCLGNSKKYFLPLFVEYLLLAASLLYQIWKDSWAGDRNMSLLEIYIREQRNLPGNTVDTISENGTDRNSATSVNAAPRRYHRNPRLGFIIGGCFAAVFIVLLVFAYSFPGAIDYHIAYSIAILILYLAQMCACFICQASLQSHQCNPEHLSLDHEDVLLYFSLIGIVLWEGFHAYTILLKGLQSGCERLDFVSDILAMAQNLFQTVTLVKLRRHKGPHDQYSIWICECIWFLLVVNLSLWVQESFFIGATITTPGERFNTLQHKLGNIGYIVHPLSIFYRFHSAVCCVLARPLFKS